MPIPIERISVCNLLSFGESAEPLELRPLNVLIGINGSGKSNLIETIGLLASMNTQSGMSGYIGRSGGILNWLWKGTEAVPIARLDVSGGLLDGRHFKHRTDFTRVEQSIEVVDESVTLRLRGERHQSKPLFGYEKGVPVFRPHGRARFLKRSDVNFTQSILWQDQLEEIANNLSPLSRLYRSFRIYRMSHIEQAKQPQRTDSSSDYLSPDGTNLSVVLSYLMQRKGFQKKLIDKLIPTKSTASGRVTRRASSGPACFLRENARGLAAREFSPGKPLPSTAEWPGSGCLQRPQRGLPHVDGPLGGAFL